MKKTLILLAITASLALTGCNSLGSFGEVTYDPVTGHPVARVGWGTPPPAPAPVPLELPKRNEGFAKL